MPKISLAGFKDPVRRPRYIIWTGVVLLILLPVATIGIGITSTRWFCAQGCHKVQDDLIAAYEHGTHSEISCLACHEPVNADPVTFMLLKTKALKELYETVTDTFHFPLNPGSALALNEEEMGATQCTQCHSANRVVTPSRGILIDHKKHADEDVWCTVCHNRVAHPETAIDLELKAPDGKANVKHPAFTKMTACFRCHDLEGKKDAPGACSTCHTADYPLKPPSHNEAGFFPKGHAELAREDLKAVEEGEKEAEELVKEGVEKRLAEPVSYCGTCHIKSQFCTGCHGVDVPHPKNWLKTHGPIGKRSPRVCANCHAKSQATAVGTIFCNSCHHKMGDPTKPWISQHFKIVRDQGPSECFKCHSPTFCAHCHVRGGKL